MTTKLKQQKFVKRRSELMNLMDENSIAILPAATVKKRNSDVDYAYRQDSDFYYLSGFDEPEAVLVFIPGRAQGEYILFCREKDSEKEIWDGSRVGQEGAVNDYLADDAFPITDIDDVLPGLVEGKRRVYYTMGHDLAFDQLFMGWINHIRQQIKTGAKEPEEFVALQHLIHEMRLIKSSDEIKLLKKSAQLAAKSHCRAMEFCQPGLYEYQVSAEILHVIQQENAAISYLPIVGSGNNACILHYIKNDQQLNDGDLLLIDAGAEIDHYASDITRTFPINGKFTPAQKAIYEIVLDAQIAAIEVTKPGNHWMQPHDAAVQVITKGLISIGLLAGSLQKRIADKSYQPFFMHKTGHWLGMDVHDVGDYRIDGQWRELEAGMVMTVEPGIYISEKMTGIPSKYKGIGVRIEDDVVVTKQGNSVLSDDAPKTINSIESLMAG